MTRRVRDSYVLCSHSITYPLIEQQTNTQVPGGSSLHSPMSSHGPDANATVKATDLKKLEPHFFDKGLAFMFETSATMRLTDFSLSGEHRDVDYQKCWSKIPRRFDPKNVPKSEASDLMAWRSEGS